MDLIEPNESSNQGDDEVDLERLVERLSVQELQEILYKFCREGSEKGVELLLSRDKNRVEPWLSRGQEGVEPSMTSGKQGTVSRLSCDVDVNMRDKHGYTPLMLACINGNAKIVELLVECGANVNDRKEDGWTALMELCRRGNEKCVELLMCHDVDVNARDQIGRTALMEACRNGKVKVVALLIERVTDVNGGDWGGYTALMKACSHKGDELDCQRVIEILLQHGACTDIQDIRHKQTALMMAAQKEKARCLEKLLSWNPRLLNLELTDIEGNTVFGYALRSNNAESLRLLLVEGRLLSGGQLRPVHKKAKTSFLYAIPESLVIMLEAGVFEWDWCSMANLKAAGLAALKAGLCPGDIEYLHGSSLRVSPLIVSLLAYDPKAFETFTRHLYYYPEDYRTLSSSNKITERIRNKTALQEITRHPLSLHTWSFLNVSKLISMSGPAKLRHQKVNSLDIPDTLKEKLKFETETHTSSGTDAMMDFISKHASFNKILPRCGNI